MHLREEKINEKLIYDGKIIRVTRDEVVLEDGSNAIREIVHHSGGVCAAPLTEDGRLLFVKQFRYPYDSVLMEFPAGKRELFEDPFEGAKRELKEEIGATAKRWIDLGQMYPTVAYDTEIIYMYLALELDIGDAMPDEGEFIDVVSLPFDEAYEMVMDNKIKDAKTQLMILKIKELINMGEVSL